MACYCHKNNRGLRPGAKIHCKEVFENSRGEMVRVGSAEDYEIVYVSKEFVIFQVISSIGNYLGERCLSLEDFEETYELCHHST